MLVAYLAPLFYRVSLVLFFLADNLTKGRILVNVHRAFVDADLGPTIIPIKANLRVHASSMGSHVKPRSPEARIV